MRKNLSLALIALLALALAILTVHCQQKPATATPAATAEQ